MKESKTFSSAYAYANTTKFAFLPDRAARCFFEETLCRSSPACIAKMTQLGFDCFKVYLTWANDKEIANPAWGGTDPILAKPAPPVKTLIERLQGWSLLWNIAFQAEMAAVREHAKTCLVDVMEKLCIKYKAKRKEVVQRALETALDHVKDLSNARQAQIALKIIEAIIDKYSFFYRA
jgi:hypothetical protein